MSSASSVSSLSSLLQTSDANSAKRKSPMQELEDAIKSGDLAKAKQIYQKIAARASSQKDATGDQSGQVSDDFKALGAALDSGDLSAAQKAMDTFKADAQKAFEAAKTNGASTNATADNTTLALPTDTVGNLLNTVV